MIKYLLLHVRGKYERRFKDTDLFEQIFCHILTAADRKLISAEYVFVDSTHVKANSNKRK
ncbi:hypothetical protein [Peribacillus frigoritolerans]|uniref:hypothetical protein n=1 Tax=Peribacillus frigoritolerans TaxID=450367 RepID=UPI00207A0F8D|nr:hypothetical protein [Peribacillus frigoritolerans]USK67685.1 hypothetical protein LIT26_14420 [Peribacillus frigoritolerans]